MNETGDRVNEQPDPVNDEGGLTLDAALAFDPFTQPDEFDAAEAAEIDAWTPDDPAVRKADDAAFRVAPEPEDKPEPPEDPAFRVADDTETPVPAGVGPRQPHSDPDSERYYLNLAGDAPARTRAGVGPRQPEPDPDSEDYYLNLTYDRLFAPVVTALELALDAAPLNNTEAIAVRDTLSAVQRGDLRWDAGEWWATLSVAHVVKMLSDTFGGNGAGAFEVARARLERSRPLAGADALRLAYRAFMHLIALDEDTTDAVAALAGVLGNAEIRDAWGEFVPRGTRLSKASATVLDASRVTLAGARDELTARAFDPEVRAGLDAAALSHLDAATELLLDALDGLALARAVDAAPPAAVPRWDLLEAAAATDTPDHVKEADSLLDLAGRVVRGERDDTTTHEIAAEIGPGKEGLRESTVNNAFVGAASGPPLDFVPPTPPDPRADEGILDTPQDVSSRADAGLIHQRYVEAEAGRATSGSADPGITPGRTVRVSPERLDRAGFAHRIYLEPGQSAPEGVTEQTGERGGRYYEATGEPGEAGPEQRAPEYADTDSAAVAALRPQMVEVEDRIRMQPAETMVALNLDGTPLYEQNGTAGAVDVPLEAALGMRNGVVTHNHPSGTASFSPDDLLFAFSTDVAALRSVTPMGTRCELRRPEGGWDATALRVCEAYAPGVLARLGGTPYAAYEYLVKQAEAATRAELGGMIRDVREESIGRPGATIGSVTAREAEVTALANARHGHDRTKRLAALGLFEYEVFDEEPGAFERRVAWNYEVGD